MTNKPLLSAAFIALPMFLVAQPQPENTSFEDWTNVGQATEEPVNWSSLKTSDGGAFINALVPQLCWRSTEAHTGQYSVNLRTVNSAVGAANGLLTNGRVHAELAVENSYMYTVQNDAQWNTPMTSKPDSLVGWFKASPQPGDRANIGALLHVDEGRLPAFGTEANWVAGLSWKAPAAIISDWTRFSEPFQYLSNADPEWILFILTAGDSTGSQVGTEAWFDDLALIYNVQALPDVALAYVTAEDDFPLNVAYTTGGIPTGPTDFTAELSDANGDFTAPTVLGVLNSTLNSGSIPCIIPVGTPPGAGYRIRVTTPSPFYAPVDAGIVVEVNTALDARPAFRDWRAWVGVDGLWLDLRSTGLRTADYEVLDARGSRVGAGRALPGTLQRIPVDAAPGMLVVRLLHAEGLAHMRVMRP